MNFSKFFQSKAFKIITWIVAGLIVFLAIFKLGMFIGYKKANFSYRWGENYHRNFGGPAEGFFKDFISDKRDFTESHGVFGRVLKIDNDAVVVKGQDGVEKIVLIKEDTSFTNAREKVQLSDLRIDDYVVVIGRPNEAGQIEAKMIRIMPFLPPVSPLSSSPKPLKKSFWFW